MSLLDPHTYVPPSYCRYHCCNMQKLHIYFPHLAQLLVWHGSHNHSLFVHSCQQKSIGLKFSKSQTGNDVRYSCHHNSSCFTFPIICAFVPFLCPPFITINHTAYILTEDNTFASFEIKTLIKLR